MAVNNLRAELQKYGKLYKQKFKSELKKDNTYASGRLDRSVTYKTKSTNSYSELSLLANSYIEQISEGRRIGRIPSSTKILEWAKEKGITVRFDISPVIIATFASGYLSHQFFICCAVAFFF